MKIITLIIFLFLSLNSVNAGYNWDKIVYTHSFVGNENSKTYYTINIDSFGSGKLEYYVSGKVKTIDFKVSRKNLNYLNNKINKSGIYSVDPKNLNSSSSPESINFYTMTLTLEEKFGDNYEYKFDRKKLPPKDEIGRPGPEPEKKKNDKGEKAQIIPIPSNINPDYKKQFYDLYHEIELIVPGKVWRESGLK